MNRSIAIVVALTVVLISQAFARQPEADVPTPDQIIERYLEATGGREARERISTRMIHATFSQGEDAAAIPMTVYKRVPGQQHVDMALGGLEGRQWVVDGETAWSVADGQIVPLMGAELRETLLRARMFPFLDWKESFASASLIGRQRIGEQVAFIVRFETPDCDVFDCMFGADDGLLLRTEMNLHYGGIEYHAQDSLSAYAEHDGLLMPMQVHRILNFPQQQVEQWYEYRTVTHNVPLPDSLFERPPEVPDPAKAEGDLPDVGEIIERSIEATGGRAAWESATRRHTVGTFHQNGQRFPIEIWQESPGRKHVRIQRGQAGEFVSVADGEDSWQIDEGSVVAAGGDEKRQNLLRSVFDPLVEWQKHFRTGKTIGKADLPTGKAIEVLLSTPHCDESRLFFDVASGRLVRSEATIIYAGLEVPTETTVGAYKEFPVRDGSIWLPTVSRRNLVLNGTQIEQVYEWELIEHDVPVPEGLFDKPFELGGNVSTD